MRLPIAIPTRPLPLLLLALLGLGAAQGALPARARACSMRHVSLFQQAEEASDIAVGRRVAGGVRVERVLKGSARRHLRIRMGTSTCAPRLRRGQRVLVLVGADHRLVAHHQSAFEDPRPELLAALDRYLSGGAAQQRAALVELSAGADEELAFESAYALADRPDLLNAVTEAEAQTLLAAARASTAVPAGAAGRSRPRRGFGALLLVIARLRPAGAAELMLSLLEVPRYVEEVAIPLELLTGHLMPNADPSAPASQSAGERWYHYRMSSGRRRFASSILNANGGPESDSATSVPTPAGAVRAHFRAWLNAHGGDNAEARFSRGFAERGVPAPSESDPRALAEVIRRGPDSLSRAFALERCERLIGRSLSSVHTYSRGSSASYWRELATACEAGVVRSAPDASP